MVRVRRVNNQQDLEHQLDEYLTLDYKIINRRKNQVLLKKKDWGDGAIHLGIFAALGWWTLGISNVAYAFYKYHTAERILITIPDARDEPQLSNDSSPRLSPRDYGDVSDNWSYGSRIRNIIFHMYSSVVFIFIILSIYVLEIGAIQQRYTILLIGTVASAVTFRYVLFYHQFSNPLSRWLTLIPAFIIFMISGIVSFDTFVSSVSANELLRPFRSNPLRIGLPVVLPNWWFVILHIPAAILALVGKRSLRNISPYPKPSRIRSIATSPVYFGLTCTFFGLWAVLLVGIAIQRVIVIAPIFEEFLKFGVALLIGSTLFDRSLSARAGVALVVGSSFGLIEHSTTYPTEADVIYLFRTVFHATTTVLSVTVYTIFESREESKLQWISPAYPVTIHFFYNTFGLISAIFSITILGFQGHAAQLVYGFVAILLLFGLLLLAVIYQEGIITIHQPIEQVLSDFV